MGGLLGVRRDPPFVADERTMLESWLDWHRATVRVKTAGLSEAGARKTPIPTSPLMSVCGLVSHLRWVENYWFGVVLLGEPDRAPSARAAAADPGSDPGAEPDYEADWRVPGGVTLVQLVDAYDAQCARSREIAVAFSLDHVTAPRPRDGAAFSVRWILHHMIEETARHNGHLDVLREYADGTKGE